jgi:hypothetical protein
VASALRGHYYLIDADGDSDMENQFLDNNGSLPAGDTKLITNGLK